MSRGGARARSGPAPDPNALRRERDKSEWVDLPRDGRKGKPSPAWPFADLRPFEQTIWDRVWAMPQAVMWQANGQELEVASYCRGMALEATAETVPAAVVAQTQRKASDLGLTVPGRRANRWRIVDEDTPAVSATPSRRQARPVDVRGRLKAV